MSGNEVSVDLEMIHLGTYVYEVYIDGVVKGHRVRNRDNGDRYYANKPMFVSIEDAELYSEPGVRPWCYDEHPEHEEVFFATFGTLEGLVKFIKSLGRGNMKTCATQAQVDARRKLTAAMRERTDEPLWYAVRNKDGSRFCAIGFVQDNLRKHDENWDWVDAGIIHKGEPMLILDNKKYREEYYEWENDRASIPNGKLGQAGPVIIPVLRDRCIEKVFAMDREEQTNIIYLSDTQKYSWVELADHIDGDTNELQLQEESNEISTHNN